MYEDMDELIPQSKNIINKRNTNFLHNFFVNIFMKIDRKSFINTYLDRLQHMTLIGIINDPIASSLFGKYIQLGQKSISDSMIRLKCYQLCNNIIENSKLLREANILENLIDLCPSYSWELKLKHNFSQQNKTTNRDIKNMLTFLKRESIIELECHPDYHRFISDISSKSKIIKMILKNIYHENNKTLS